MSLTNKGLLLVKDCLGTVMNQTGKKLDYILEFLDKYIIASQKREEEDKEEKEEKERPRATREEKEEKEEKNEKSVELRLLYALYNMKLPDFIPQRNIFKKNQKLTIESNKNMGLLKKGKNTLKIYRALGKGSYGIVFLTTLNGFRTATKVPIPIYDIVEEFESFLRENLIHIFLKCFKDRLIKDLPIKDLPIPDIYFLGRINTKVETILLSTMQVMDSPLPNVIETEVDSSVELIDLFLQVAYGIKYLQESADFMHRDLHSGNIMVKLLKGDEVEEIEYGNRTFIRTMRVYFIDFGQTCINLGKCGPCKLTNSELVAGGGSYGGSAEFYCNNPTYDLRIFLGSIRFRPLSWSRVEHFSRGLAEHLELIFEPYDEEENKEDYLDVNLDEPYQQKKDNAPKWHRLYKTLEYEDEEFLPDNIIKTLTSFV